MSTNLVPLPDNDQPNAMQPFTGLTREDVELLKATICKDATDAELRLFVAVCNQRRLNPFTKQIHFVKRKQYNAKLNGGRGGYEEVGTHQTGIDGYRLIAERTGRYGGPVGTWWCGPDGEWRDVWLEDHPPAAAKVAVRRTDFAGPSEEIARWKAYVQTRSGSDQPNAMWAQRDAEQLAKCAEALVLRKVFPEELSGIYTTDEMAQADNDRVDYQTGEIIGELEAEGEHGAVQVDAAGLPLPEIIAAIRRPEHAHHLLKDPDLSDNYRQAVRRTVEGDGLSWPSFWRTASPLAWGTILDRALTACQASETTGPATAPTPAPQGGEGGGPGPTSEAGERPSELAPPKVRHDPASDANVPEPNAATRASSVSGAPTSPASPGDAKPGRGRTQRGTGKAPAADAPAGSTDEAADQLAYDQRLANDPSRHTR